MSITPYHSRPSIIRRFWSGDDSLSAAFPCPPGQSSLAKLYRWTSGRYRLPSLPARPPLRFQWVPFFFHRLKGMP